jgi:hypothetical protein
MNSCILITSHLNTTKKVRAAITQLDFFKKINNKLPIIYVGNYPIPDIIQHYPQVKECHYTSDNPLTKNHRKLHIIGKGIIPDYGYAHLSQILLGFNICKTLGYDYVHHFNYDVILEEEEYNKLLEKSKDYKFLYYKWEENSISTSFFSIPTQKFLNALSPNAHFYYNDNPPGIAEGWFFETFFKWAFLFSKTYESLEDFSDIKYTLLVDNLE